MRGREEWIKQPRLGSQWLQRTERGLLKSGTAKTLQQRVQEPQLRPGTILESRLEVTTKTLDSLPSPGSWSPEVIIQAYLNSMRFRIVRLGGEHPLGNALAWVKLDRVGRG
jgi:hypothetical protein